MSRWFLAGLLYADGMPLKSVAVVLGVGFDTAGDYIKTAKANLLGVTGFKANGAKVGFGTKLELRQAYVDAGWLTEPTLVT